MTNPKNNLADLRLDAPAQVRNVIHTPKAAKMPWRTSDGIKHPVTVTKRVREVGVRDLICADLNRRIEFREVAMSDCEYGCKVYEHPDGERVVAHSLSYGCHVGDWAHCWREHCTHQAIHNLAKHPSGRVWGYCEQHKDDAYSHGGSDITDTADTDAGPTYDASMDPCSPDFDLATWARS